VLRSNVSRARNTFNLKRIGWWERSRAASCSTVRTESLISPAIVFLSKRDQHCVRLIDYSPRSIIILAQSGKNPAPHFQEPDPADQHVQPHPLTSSPLYVCLPLFETISCCFSLVFQHLTLSFFPGQRPHNTNENTRARPRARLVSPSLNRIQLHRT
jgi:hypothetical protein